MIRIKFSILAVEKYRYKLLSQDNSDRGAGIDIVCAHDYIGNIGPNGKSGIGREGPGGGGPCKKEKLRIQSFKEKLRFFVADHLKLCHAGCVLYIAVTTGLVQLVRA
ncbi:hypothetical protein ES705_21922 [subsurface metagenome]